MKNLNAIFFLFFAANAFSQTADFTYTIPNNAACAPVKIAFTQNCTGNPQSFLWDFGNNIYSNSANPSFNFTQKGSYQISLTAVYAQSSVTVKKTIIIDSSKAISVSSDKNFICSLGTINFTINGSTGITSAVWDFNNGSPKVTANGNTLSYNFQQFGNDSVSVRATENSGCIDTASIKVAVLQPPIITVAAPSSGCIPANVQLSASVTVPAGDFVTDYQWNFGDGTANANTSVNNIQHTYSATGKYQPVISVTTNSGCTNIDTFQIISFGDPPLNFTASALNDTICASDSMTVFFKDKNANGYLLNWGDGSRDFVEKTNTYLHKYDTLGNVTIRIIPFNNGCAGNSVSIKAFIKGVISSFDFNNSCANKNLFRFFNTSLGNETSFLWDFGDGSNNNINNNPQHIYTNPDSFSVHLFVYDNVSGCQDSASKILYVDNPVLQNNKTAVCKDDSVNFYIEGSFMSPETQYTWQIDDNTYGPTDTSSLTVLADSSGKFSNYAVINKGINYCPDTVKETNPFFVRGTNLVFAIADSICQNSYISAINQSARVSGNDSVIEWQWNFAGSSAQVSTLYQPPPVFYSDLGEDSVILTATDNYGCVDSIVKYFKIEPLPFVQILSSLDTVCFGDAKQLIAFHSDNIRWSPANEVSCATCDTTLVSPINNAQFIATAFNQYGCTAYDTVVATVYKPFVISAPFTDTAVCLNDSVQLNVNSNNYPVRWIPSSGLSSAVSSSPFAFPDKTTQYSAIVSDSAGCFTDTLKITVAIKSSPVVDAGPNEQYDYNTSFTLQPTYSSNIISYEWLPSNSLSCNNCAMPGGIADFTKTYTVTVTSDSGCTAKDSVTIFVGCLNSNLLMPTAFTPNNDGRNDIYYPLGRGIKTIKKFAIYNRYGQIVFIKENFSPNLNSYGWNGKINGYDQPRGTYIYIVDFVCDIGEAISSKGTFVLIR